MKNKSIKIILKSTNNLTNKLYTNFITYLLKKIKLKTLVINLPKKTKRITFLKSPHVHKQAQEHFEQTTYKSMLQINYETNYNKINMILKLVNINKPSILKMSIKSFN